MLTPVFALDAKKLILVSVGGDSKIGDLFIYRYFRQFHTTSFYNKISKTKSLLQKSSQKHFFSRLSQTGEPRMSDFSAEKYATAKKVVSRKTFARYLLNAFAIAFRFPAFFAFHLHH